MSQWLARMDRDERGQILPIVLFTILWLWATVVLVWNAGAVTAQKVRMQTAADTAAYATAVTMSRATNVITATNMALVRGTSAQALMAAVPLAKIGIWANLAAAAEEYWWNPFVLAELAWEEIYSDIVLLQPGWIGIQEAFTQRLDNRLDAIHRYQMRVLAAVPGEIERLRRDIAEQFDCGIVLTQPGAFTAGADRGRQGQGRAVLAPVREGRSWEILSTAVPAVGWQAFRDRKGIEQELEPVFFGKGPTCWNVAVMASVLLITPASLQDDFCVLTSNTSFGERRPSDRQRIDDFSVVALAYDGGPHATLVLPGAFGHGVNDDDVVVAYAQAETYNGFDVPLEPLGLPLGTIGDTVRPWRVWNRIGWHWQPRLAYGDGLRRAFEADPQFRDVMSRLNLGSSDLDRIEQIATH